MIRKSSPCVPSDDTKSQGGPYSQSLSNLEDNGQAQTGCEDKSIGKANVYPNPFTDVTTIQFKNPNHKEYTLNVLDLSGRVVYQKNNITESKIELSREGLSNGYYMIELRGEDIFRGKIVVK